MKKIAIYGAGRRGVLLYQLLKTADLDKNVRVFCDREYKSKSIPKCSIEIVSYECVKKEKLIYLISVGYNHEIVQMMQEDNQEYYTSFEEFANKYYKNNEKVMFLTQKFEINDNNLLLKEYYSKANYKVIEYDTKKKICYIFFSGNGIYFSESRGALLSAFSDEDWYEWENLVEYSEISCRAAKCIYVRDVHKAWYTTGINADISTMNRLILFLNKITEGYEVITVGNSAGGYAAAIVGAKLKAKMVFSFSGQFSIYNYFNVVEEYYYLNQNKKDKEISKYYDICDCIKNTVPIIYFYPEYSEQDKIQSVFVKDMQNVMAFSIDDCAHDRTLSNKDIAKLLIMNLSDINNLYQRCKNKVIVADKLWEIDN